MLEIIDRPAAGAQSARPSIPEVSRKKHGGAKPNKPVANGITIENCLAAAAFAQVTDIYRAEWRYDVRGNARHDNSSEKTTEDEILEMELADAREVARQTLIHAKATSLEGAIGKLCMIVDEIDLIADETEGNAHTPHLRNVKRCLYGAVTAIAAAGGLDLKALGAETNFPPRFDPNRLLEAELASA